MKQCRAEAVGCLGPTRFLDALEFFQTSPLKIFSIRFAKFLTTFFLLVTFGISFQISRKFAPWMPPGFVLCPGNDIFLFLVMTFTYFLGLGTVRPPDDSSRTVRPGLFVQRTVRPKDYSSHYRIKSLA